MACPIKTGTKQDFATYKNGINEHRVHWQQLLQMINTQDFQSDDTYSHKYPATCINKETLWS